MDSSCFIVFAFHMQTCLFLPTVHPGLLRLGHGHSPHAVIRMEPCLRRFPVPFLHAPHFCVGPDPPTGRAAGPPGSPPALHVQRAPKDPPRLGEDPTHPLHFAGGGQPRVRVAAVQEGTLWIVSNPTEELPMWPPNRSLRFLHYASSLIYVVLSSVMSRCTCFQIYLLVLLFLLKLPTAGGV